jgi:hypothetical protein
VSTTNQRTPTRIKDADEHVRLMRLSCSICGTAVSLRCPARSTLWPHHRCGKKQGGYPFTSGKEVTVLRVRSPLTGELRDLPGQGDSTPKRAR